MCWYGNNAHADISLIVMCTMFYAWNVFGVEHVCYSWMVLHTCVTGGIAYTTYELHVWYSNSRMVLHACVCRSMFGVNRGCTELPTAPAAALTMKALFLTKKSTLSAGNTLGSSMQCLKVQAK